MWQRMMNSVIGGGSVTEPKQLIPYYTPITAKWKSEDMRYVEYNGRGAMRFLVNSSTNYCGMFGTRVDLTNIKKVLAKGHIVSMSGGENRIGLALGNDLKQDVPNSFSEIIDDKAVFTNSVGDFSLELDLSDREGSQYPVVFWTPTTQHEIYLTSFEFIDN